jgi:hypothetical protein
LKQFLDYVEDLSAQCDRVGLTSFPGPFRRPLYDFRVFLRVVLLEVGWGDAERPTN